MVERFRGFLVFCYNRITVIMVSAIQRIIGINYRNQNASKGVEYRGADFG
jgi:hypothetical protein